MRFVRNCSLDDISRLGAARLNILRDDDVHGAGEWLQQRFGTPFIPSFPVGFGGTIRFLESVAGSFDVKYTQTVRKERALQKEILTEFEDLSGASITFDPAGMDSDTSQIAREVAQEIAVTIAPDGCRVPLPLSPPVGTNGIRHMLHRWRRAMHARV